MKPTQPMTPKKLKEFIAPTPKITRPKVFPLHFTAEYHAELVKVAKRNDYSLVGFIMAAIEEKVERSS